MLSVDQFVSVPAAMASFLIALQVSGVGIFRAAPLQTASQ
jgi:hypothetical protein